MSTATGEPTAEVLNGIGRVVDAGAQIQESPETMVPYMREDHPVRKAIEISERPRVDVYAGTSAFPLAQYKRRDAEGTLMTEGSLGTGDAPGDEDDEEVLMPSQYGDIGESIGGDEVASLFENIGVDAGVVNPTLHAGLAEVQNDRFAVEMARAYNEWLLDNVADHESIVGNMAVAPQVPHKAAEEIDARADEDDIVGIQLPAAGLHPAPGHRRYDPIYNAASDYGLPISMHATVGAKTFAQQFNYATTYAEDFAIQPAFAQFVNITSMMFNGTLERFSDLDFVIQGGGLGYGPYLKHRLDDHYLELGYEIPELEQLPSDYMAKNFYWCTQPIGEPSPEYLEKMIRMLGTENVLFSSDVPHPYTDRPVDFLSLVGNQFEQDELKRLMAGNAADLFGI